MDQAQYKISGFKTRLMNYKEIKWSSKDSGTQSKDQTLLRTFHGEKGTKGKTKGTENIVSEKKENFPNLKKKIRTCKHRRHKEPQTGVTRKEPPMSYYS